MKKLKKVRKVSKSIPTTEGAGVKLRRAFGFQYSSSLDPFLLLDDFHSKDPEEYIRGFPWHPHRGIETITYVLKGEIKHEDSMGNAGVIAPGDVQWMTAGNGIIHQEMPKKVGDGELWGYQLWANLPSSHKMMDPRYRGIKGEEIPKIELDDGSIVRIISGEIDGVKGPVKDIITKPEYFDVKMPANSTFTYEIEGSRNVFAYVIGGQAFFDDSRDEFAYEREPDNYLHFEKDPLIKTHSLVQFGEGNVLKITTESKPVRFLLASGVPIKEPVEWYGPIVMNTREELRTAFQEYRNGKFVKKKK